MNERWKRVRDFPLTLIGIAGGYVLLPVYLLSAVLHHLPLSKTAAGFAASLGGVALAILGYRLYVRRLERRDAAELSLPGALSEFLAGCAIGAALFSATIAILAALGVYSVSGTSPATAMFIPLVAGMTAGFIEEILLRGIVFRILEGWIGSWPALAISAAVFGLLHLVNPHATLVGALSIILEAGVMLAAAFMLTRRLWLAIGIHGAWNFTQGGIFGVPVSGMPMTGLLHGEMQGPIWLSGGEFGAEASAVAVLVCLIAAVLLLTAARRRGRVMPASWRKAPAAAISSLEGSQS